MMSTVTQLRFSARLFNKLRVSLGMYQNESHLLKKRVLHLDKSTC